MAAGDLPQTADPLGAALGQALFGGTTQTVSPGNIAQLEQVLAQLQGQDFTALLQSIFQQAAGQIPGLQAAYGNAMGARSGGNSAVQAALNELLKQTTLAGQQQIASQQAQNFQTQGQAAANIAQATRGTQTTQGADLGGIAKNLLLLQGLSMLTGKSGPLSDMMDKVGDVGKSVGGMFTPTPQATATTGLGGQGMVLGAGQGMGTGGGVGMQGQLPDLSFGGYEAPQYDLGSLYTETYGPSLGLQAPQYDFSFEPGAVDYSLIGDGGTGGLGLQLDAEDFFPMESYGW